MRVDLQQELDAAAARVTQLHLNRLLQLGVSRDAIANLGRDQIPFGVAGVTDDGDGLYQPGGSIPSIVQPIYDLNGLVDLVAWRSSNPMRWRLRTGLGWLLGAQACLYGGWEPGVLTLHASPLDWLRAGCTGGVIVDWSSGDIDTLRSFDTIYCADPRQAELLDRCFRRPAPRPTLALLEVRDAA